LRIATVADDLHVAACGHDERLVNAIRGWLDMHLSVVTAAALLMAAWICATVDPGVTSKIC
jgi:hypothetical protein